MSIVAIVSSPRKNGFGNHIADEMVAGARSAGKDVSVYRLNELSPFRQCQGCEACKGSDGDCILDDDITTILDEVRDSEGLMLITSINFNEVNGLFKMFEDRFYRFLDINASTILPKGKKLAVAVTAGLDDSSAERVSRGLEKVMAEHFFFEPVGRLAYTTWMMPLDAPVDPDLLKEAREIGSRF